MEAVLWYVLTGTRGGSNRVRLLRALHRQSMNANELASELDLDYKTVRHHLEVLVDNDMVVRVGDGYGAEYAVSRACLERWEVVERITSQLE